ncbi:hypothetical protein AYO44_06815 [Planctomycetaceae bacterium SCGC AG-212-F19]|nr:hypothetical protein AYO44_06815 [Planctomycetaceae bacterium SCGC AG-212-F19]
MEHPELTPELADLETALVHDLPAAPAGLRNRVLMAVRKELAVVRPPHSPGTSWSWYAAGVAAACLLALNLFLITGNNLAGRPVGPRAAALVQQVLEAVPELTPEEARSQALLYSAGGRFPLPAPLVAPPHPRVRPEL